MTITVVTANIRATATTTPPMTAAVLSVSEQLHVDSVALFSASQTSETSDANMIANSWYTQNLTKTCYTLPVEKVMS